MHVINHVMHAIKSTYRYEARTGNFFLWELLIFFNERLFWSPYEASYEASYMYVYRYEAYVILYRKAHPCTVHVRSCQRVDEDRSKIHPFVRVASSCRRKCISRCRCVSRCRKFTWTCGLSSFHMCPTRLPHRPI